MKEQKEQNPKEQHDVIPENKNINNLIKGIIIVPNNEKGVTIPIKINPMRILGPYI